MRVLPWRREFLCGFLSEFRCEFLRSALAFLEGSNDHEKSSQDSQRNPWPNSHGRVGEKFTDSFCRVASVIFLARKCRNLDRVSIASCRIKSGKNFPAASKFCQKILQQGISDSHSLLEFLLLEVSKSASIPSDWKTY